MIHIHCSKCKGRTLFDENIMRWIIALSVVFSCPPPPHDGPAFGLKKNEGFWFKVRKLRLSPVWHHVFKVSRKNFPYLFAA